MSRARGVRPFTALLLAGGALLAGGVPAAADAGEGDGTGDAPTEAGTTFRTATVIGQGTSATASASTGDYLYWTFPVAAGQTATAEATVTLPDTAPRSGPATWQLDVYDGLRRRQPCTEGPQTVRAEQDAASVSLSCTLPTVRPWAEPWSDAPLPGGYYLRLTVTELPERDLGLPVTVEARATAEEAGGSAAYGGALADPLLPVGAAGVLAGDTADTGDTGDTGDTAEDGAADTDPYLAALPEPDGGWGGGWWTDRWLWTTAGGVLGALAGLGGFRLVRGPRARREA
ncbi:hypothetical protein [Streptomyces avicenniae]|uniref:hypothetical protein n=1 Tax=Streptomyces avicenniae TaxID=500153 RepID=UPI00069ACE74|nr:hypothetical protein [Streptomyces avicenniae]